MMKRIGILGGTFNPPHNGHLLIANEVKSAYDLDSIRFMPNALSPFKSKDHCVTDQQRVQMLELLLQDFPAGEIENVEIERGGVSYTIDTMLTVAHHEPNTEFYLIIGADQIEHLVSWHRIDELIRLVTLVGVPRPGYKTETPFPIEILPTPQLDVSSTELRRRLAVGKTTRFLMPTQVASYCEENELYVEPK